MLFTIPLLLRFCSEGEWALFNWPVGHRRKKPVSDKEVPAQPVDATPSVINLFTKGGVYDASETGEALRDAEERDVEPLEVGTVVA